MITSQIFRSALALSFISSSGSFVHLNLQSMSSNAASSLRRSSRLSTSTYFSGAAVGQQHGRTSSYFAAAASVSDESARDVLPARKTSTKRKDGAGKPHSAKKQKASQTKATTAIERTQSFEPAWWGNVLVDRTQSTLAAKINQNPNEPSNADYPPVHTLILGTHPSIASLSNNQFYGHALNAFWYIAGDALGFRRNEAISPTTKKPYALFYNHLRYDESKIIEYDAQLELFVSQGFALWDIIRECERKGSLDTDINRETPNSIREFCEERGSVRRIVIANGTTGGKFFVKHFKDWFVNGGIVAAQDEMSQRCFKSAMNSAKRAAAVAAADRPAIEVVCLPSVSPAAAKFTYLEKREAWDRWCFGPGLIDYDNWIRQSNLQTEKPPVPSDETPEKQGKTEANTAITPTPTKKLMKSTPPRSTSTVSSQKSSTPNRVAAVQFLSADIAKLSPQNDWIDLQVPPKELRPSATLTNGQCFNWMVVDGDSSTAQAQKLSAWGTHDASEWIGPLGDRVFSIKETPTTTLYRVLYGPEEGATEDLLNYFRLETPLAPLYKEWSDADARLSKIAAVIPGCRILRQDPIECMFSFICSSNNNIPRITKMLTSFRKDYGQFMMTVPTQSGEDYALYSFPTLQSMSTVSEDDLRSMGLGYRAKYITETRDLLTKCGGRDYLLSLRAEPDAQVVQDELVKFSGIGRKVADCIALFSLDSDEAIPVDVHVQHIASRDYDSTILGGAKSITPTIYKRVGDLFRSRFLNYAGWAHTLLFVAELPSFRSVLPSDIVQQMDEWREHEQRKKQEQKLQKKSQDE